MTDNYKETIADYFDRQAPERVYWKRKNWYYHKTIENLLRFIVPQGDSVIEIGSGPGDLLASLKPKRGVGIDISPKMSELAKKRYPNLDWCVADGGSLEIEEKFKYVVVSDTLGYLADVPSAFGKFAEVCDGNGRLVITYYNYFWEPILRFAEIFGLKGKQSLQHWLSEKDIENLLDLARFQVVKRGKKMLMPFYIPILSDFVNRFIANLPLINRFCLIQYFVARPEQTKKTHSVSVIIPARNEKGNIEEIVRRLPKFGKGQEIIFVEGGSTDGTFGEIKRVSEKYGAKRNILYTTQEGKGKGDAVRKGFKMAGGAVLMILDADLSVAPEDLPKFYKIITSGKADFVNGSRLVYPMEKEAMRFLNIIGNKFFSLMFTWILGERVKDTLCGTKVLYKADYEKIEADRSYFGNFDPFGDFDLLFGAVKFNLKIVELPVRYHARNYGTTNIKRWSHGWLLLKMVWFAMKKIKFV